MLMLTVSASAQTISFLGVPLAGRIDKFTEQLACKGAKYNKPTSNQFPDGIRLYDVRIFPYPCMAKVEYNTSTRNVYEAVLMFQMRMTLKEFTEFFDMWSTKINEKYSKGIYTIDYEEDEYKSYPADHYTVYSSKTNKKIGDIYLYMDIMEKPTASNKGKFSLHILYRNSEAPSFEDQMEDIY